MSKIDNILSALAEIKRGQRVIYYRGQNLSKLDKEVSGTIRELLKEKKVRTHMRRVSKPVHKGRVDWHEGLGEFEYFLIGL